MKTKTAKEFLLSKGRREIESVGKGMTGEYIVTPEEMEEYRNQSNEVSIGTELKINQVIDAILNGNIHPLTAKAELMKLFLQSYPALTEDQIREWLRKNYEPSGEEWAVPVIKNFIQSHLLSVSKKSIHTEQEEPKGLLTDDCDLNKNRLEVFTGGNGDYYVSIIADDISHTVRIAMSGGIATTEVKLAVANLYRALNNNQPPEVGVPDITEEMIEEKATSHYPFSTEYLTRLSFIKGAKWMRDLINP